MNNNKLLCTFAREDNYQYVTRQIRNRKDFNKELGVLIYKCKDSNDIYLIYNIDENIHSNGSIKSIVIHRKKSTDTYYTINALNQVIWLNNGGKFDENYSVKWENYSNQILLMKNNKLIKNNIEKIN